MSVAGGNVRDGAEWIQLALTPVRKVRRGCQKMTTFQLPCKFNETWSWIKGAGKVSDPGKVNLLVHGSTVNDKLAEYDLNLGFQVWVNGGKRAQKMQPNFPFNLDLELALERFPRSPRPGDLTLRANAMSGNWTLDLTLPKMTENQFGVHYLTISGMEIEEDWEMNYLDTNCPTPRTAELHELVWVDAEEEKPKLKEERP